MSQPARTVDVAREAGVSRATVSYVLNDRRDVRVSETTRHHVLDVARRLGYIGSPAARALRNGRGDAVLLLVPGWEVGGQLELLLEQLGQLVAQHGLVCLRYEGPHWQGALNQLLARIPAACVVTFDPLGGDDAQALASAGVPEVTAWLLDHPGHPHTTAISQTAIVQAQVDHLLARGYRRLAYLATEQPRGRAFTRARTAAFHQICEALGVTEADSTTIPCDLPSITAAVQRWTAHPADRLGIAAYNDLTALGVLTAANTTGLRIPQDLGVIGGDDTDIAALTDPSLSSVRFNLPSEAKGIATDITKALGLPVATDLTEDAAVEVVARESTNT